MTIETDEFHSQLINDIKKYIHQNIKDKPTPGSICIISGYSRFYMQRLFRKATGKSIGEYINDVRLHQIRELLINTNMTVTSISTEFHYESSTQLTKRFKEKYGLPPRQYRKKYLSSPTSAE